MTEPPYEIGQRLRVKSGIGGGWDGLTGTVTGVKPRNDYAFWTIEMAWDRRPSTVTTTFDTTSFVGSHIEIMPLGVCGQCDGRVEQEDYLCEKCRINLSEDSLQYAD